VPVHWAGGFWLSVAISWYFAATYSLPYCPAAASHSLGLSPTGLRAELQCNRETKIGVGYAAVISACGLKRPGADGRKEPTRVPLAILSGIGLLQ
jgi:hypothetical protein